jgi:hypothetical protein
MADIQGSSTPDLVNHEAAYQLQNILTSIPILNDALINTPLTSVIAGISGSASLDDASAVQLTLLATIICTQELLLDKVTKDHDNLVDQFARIGKAFNDLYS